MKSLISIVTICVCLLGISGCARATDSPTDQGSSEEVTQTMPKSTSQNFKSNFADANRYWELIEEGMKLREEKRYDEALEALKKALNNHAAMRNEQATASDQIAITYEMKGNLEEAAKYYDLASEVTMNENRKASLSQKAKELYQKSRGTSANHDSE